MKSLRYLNIENITISEYSNYKALCIPYEEMYMPISEYMTEGLALESIILPSNTPEIENKAFSNCWDLLNVILNNQLLKIGRGAFSGCSSLESIILPQSLHRLGSSAFFSCSSIKGIIIPERIEKINSYRFFGCQHLCKIIHSENNRSKCIFIQRI